MPITNKVKNDTAAIGQRFGKLVVAEYTGKSTSGNFKRRLVKCICDCGNEKEIAISVLRMGNTKSCGCLLLETSMSNLEKAHQRLYESGVWEADPKIASAKKVWGSIYNDGDISFDDFLSLSQEDCFYCGKSPSNCCSAYGKANSKFRQENGDFIYNGLDRIDNSKGHMKDNVVSCCYPCNIGKLDRTQIEFFDWVKDIYMKHLRS